MKYGLKILDIYDLDKNLINVLCKEYVILKTNLKFNIINEFNCAPKFSIFLKNLFFNLKAKKNKSNYLKYFLKNGGMGKVALTNKDEIAGTVLYGDYCLFPSARQLISFMPDYKSIFLGHVYINPAFSEYGLNERLLLSVEEDLITKKYESVETFGKRINDDISEEEFDKISFFTVRFLISKGFYIKNNDECCPLLRMELKNIISHPKESWLERLFIRKQQKRSAVTQAGGKIKD